MANHVVYWASRMKPAKRSCEPLLFSMVSLILHDQTCFLNIESLCMMVSGLTSDILDVVHAKRSTFFFSVAFISLTSAVVMAVPTQVLCSSSRRGTCCNSSLASSLSSIVQGSRSTIATVYSIGVGWTSLRGYFFPQKDLHLRDRSFRIGSTLRLTA